MLTNEIRLKSARELDLMQAAGRVVADTLVLLKEHAREGVTTAALNALAEESLQAGGAVTSYRQVGFDFGVVCVSINEQIVHGIPGNRVLKQGDVVSLDIAAIRQGYHADAAITVGIGTLTTQARHLLETTEQALALGISLATVGRHLHDISAAIQEFVERRHLNVMRNLVGHGIGRQMWEAPQVPNFRQNNRGPVLRAGTVFTIEPMVSIGRPDNKTLPDKWTIVTRDRKAAAHFEHTVAVTADGPRILTLPGNPASVWAGNPPLTRQMETAIRHV
ncbi:MAG TPA: type I methionyl aminopeptidase [Chloroflexota bacterium]|nr:type I methionyl aminopeptidase [Chloroflexota bacterium]